MRNAELRKQYDIIKSLIEGTSAATSGNLRLQRHWGNYTCVLVAGLLENSVKEVYGEFIRNTMTNGRNHQLVARYATSRLGEAQNPKAERFIQTANAFNLEWGRELEIGLLSSNSPFKNAIDSVMETRHRIAHGKNTSISLAHVKEYLEKAAKVIDFIESQCDRN